MPRRIQPSASPPGAPASTAGDLPSAPPPPVRRPEKSAVPSTESPLDASSCRRRPQLAASPKMAVSSGSAEDRWRHLIKVAVNAVDRTPVAGSVQACGLPDSREGHPPASPSSRAPGRNGPPFRGQGHARSRSRRPAGRKQEWCRTARCRWRAPWGRNRRCGIRCQPVDDQHGRISLIGPSGRPPVVARYAGDRQLTSTSSCAPGREGFRAARSNAQAAAVSRKRPLNGAGRTRTLRAASAAGAVLLDTGHWHRDQLRRRRGFRRAAVGAGGAAQQPSSAPAVQATVGGDARSSRKRAWQPARPIIRNQPSSGQRNRTPAGSRHHSCRLPGAPKSAFARAEKERATSPVQPRARKSTPQAPARHPGSRPSHADQEGQGQLHRPEVPACISIHVARGQQHAGAWSS